MDEEPTALELANAASSYLTEELDRSPAEFIPVHRDIAMIALGIVNAAVDALEREAR